MKLDKLIYENELTNEEDLSIWDIEIVTTKPNEITHSSLFVFLQSEFFNVERIADYVMAKSPIVILADNELKISSDRIKILRCKSTRDLLPFIYSRFYNINYDRLKFCAVTGTNGKTTTATMIHHILRKRSINAGFIGTGKILINEEKITDDNYSMTTPDPDILYRSIKRMEEAECKIIVMEVSSHALYYNKVAPIFFEISIFTNLSPEHLDFHKNMDEYFKTKLKLFSKTKYGIFNLDDPYGRLAYESMSENRISFSANTSADAMAEEIKEISLMKTEFKYLSAGKKTDVILKLGGRYNVYNAALAICATALLGIDEIFASKAISGIEYIDGRLEIISNKITVIIDYAHTHTALENVLKTIISYKNTEQRLLTVFGCGGNRDRYKRPKMAAVAEKHSDSVIVTADNSRNEPLENIIADILKGFKSTNKRIVITSRAAAIEHAILSAKDGDLIAIIGKGHERYNIDENGYSTFDEREIVKKAIAKRNGEKL